MSTLLEAVVPARLGRGFRWFLVSTWVSSLGDGLVLAAGPLLVASQTDQEFLVALAALLQWLPPFLFGLFAGVVTDRLDRRLVVVVVNLVRVGVLGLIAASVLTGAVSIALVLLAMFLLGTCEVFADNTSSTFVPMLVHRDDLGIANSRVTFGYITINQLIGPPVGAALFAAGMAWPFAAEALLLLLAIVLLTRVALPSHGRDPEADPTRIRHDILEGIRWTWRHGAVRTLALTILIFNVTFGAAWSVLVLYAGQRLGLGALGFGLITTVSAVGGLVGSLSYGWITRRVSLGDVMRVGLIIETLTHLGLALTTSPYVAMPIFFVFGAHAFIWGTTSTTIRQRAVPTELQGRVGSVYVMAVFAGLVVGSGIGGLLAQHLGVTAPFWFAFVGSAVFVVAIWQQLHHLKHDEPAVESVTE